MPVARISVMTMVFGGELSTKKLGDVEMLQGLENMGFDGVELTAGRVLAEPELLDTYKAYLADSPLEVTCIDGPCNLIGADQATRDTGIDALRCAIDVAEALGAPLVLAAGSQLSGDITPADGRRMTADGLRACQPMSEAAGITLAIEDFGVAPTLQCRAADCLDVLDQAPGVAFVFDTGNFYFAGEDPLGAFDVLAPKTCHVHLKDWVKSDTPQIADVAGAPLGAGLIPNRDLVRRFLDAGITSFSLESGGPGPILDVVRRDLKTVRS